MATYTGGTTSNIQFSNGTCDQIYFWGNDSATTATTNAGGFTDTGTTSGTATDSIIWTNAYMGLGTIQGIGIGNQTIRTDIHMQPYEQVNIRQARPGELTVPIRDLYQAQRGRTQGPDEAPVVQRIEPAEPTPQIIANARGQDLLKEIVGDVMYRRFQKEGWIDVPSLEKPGIMYRIKPWHEIALLEKNAKKEWVSNNQSLCIHARQRHVEGDEVAAHVLLCRYNEKTLWKMGNLHGVRRAA
jgi:hypothetical protein